MRGAASRWLKLSLGFAVTAGFAWLLARELDLGALGRAFSGLSLSVVPIALVFLAAGYTVRIARWWCMLRALEPGLPLAACAGPFLASIAVNNVLPFRAGDAYRVLGFRQQLRSPAMRVAGTLVVERTLDLVVLCAIFFLGLLGLPDGAFPRGFVVAAAWLAGMGMAALLALLAFPSAARWYTGRWPGQPAPASAMGAQTGRRWPEAVFRHGAHLADALGLMRSPPRMLALLGLSVVAWACEGAVFVTVAAGIGADVAPSGPWLSLAAGALATVLPSSPGYVGTFDYFAAQGLAAHGAPPEAAAVFALTVHAVLWAPLTAAGLLFLLARGARLRESRGGAEAPPPLSTASRHIKASAAATIQARPREGT